MGWPTTKKGDLLRLLPVLIVKRKREPTVPRAPVVDAIAYAHSRGIVHRDLKPNNVLVGAFGETVVIDWGLAKKLTASDDTLPVDVLPQGTGVTHVGTVMGTPAYMPPEQAVGAIVDARADVYALGAMLYHLLAAGHPIPERLPHVCWRT
jgi:serine/threonine protein kinase